MNPYNTMNLNVYGYIGKYCGPYYKQGDQQISFITLFRSMTMLCGIDDIMWDIPHIQSNDGMF